MADSASERLDHGLLGRKPPGYELRRLPTFACGQYQLLPGQNPPNKPAARAAIRNTRNPPDFQHIMPDSVNQNPSPLMALHSLTILYYLLSLPCF
ncbi:hypothetical protein D3C74_421390 [compost metagenome]